MKSIKIKNTYVAPIHNLLNSLALTGKASRGRTKFLKRLEEKNKEFLEDLEALQKEYFETDENGDLIADDKGKLTFNEDLDFDEYNSKYKGIENEQAEISFGEYSTKYEAMFNALDNLDVPLSGQDAELYDTLMDAYEAEKEIK
ncbi:hypothetical protein CJ191_01100 [Aerococcus viridans]|uniref:DUF1617 domain-containing protein n=1 Tax=Aerococcus viridans TaxID=1377 RepID=A0A2N6UFZ7_9LACT|nr:DUF1617 family protein [Aerococcus viridans]PMC80434.1 hypothetical protein CJ191_01100 [Aerococcus viridans]